MKAGHPPVQWTGTDIAEVSQSCHFVLETSPPDYVEKISQFLESSVGQSRQDPEANDSDSGDSLFLTQKSVPEAVRSQRRHHFTSRPSDPACPQDLEDSEDSLAAFCRERRRQKYRLPKYSFPFLTEKKGKLKSNLLCVQRNTRLHNSGMGGFFKCVRELWQSYKRGVDLESSLPTVDVDGEEILPLSEGEEEKSDDEDIKVVERKRLVVSVKAKCPQPWNTPQKRHNQVQQPRKRRRASNASQEMSQGRRVETLHKMPAKGPASKVTLWSSDTENTDDGGSPCRVESGKSDEHIKNGRDIVAQTDVPKTKICLTRRSRRNLFHQNAEEDELRDNSDATSPVEYTHLDGEVSVTMTTDASHIDDPSQTAQPEDEPANKESQDLLQSPPHLIEDTNGDESGVTKRKKEEGENGGEEELRETQYDATSENAEITDVQSPAQHADDTLEMNENNQMENSLHDDNTLRQEEERSVEDGASEREIPTLKEKKKKKKKNKTVENSGQEDEGGRLECDVRIEEDSVFPMSCNVVSDGTEEKKKKKKKKRKRSSEHEEDVEQLSCGIVAEPVNDDAEIQKKKKKKKKEKRVVFAEEALDLTLEKLEEQEICLENTAASQEMLDSSCVNRKKHKKKKKQSSCDDATHAGEEDGEGVNTSNDAATLAGTEKKKKKKEKTGFSTCDEIDASSGEVADKTQKTTGDEDADLVTKKEKKKKKKEKKRMSELPEDTVAQSHDSVSVQEKKKKKASSFLVADAEGNCAQTQQDKSSPTKTMALSAGALETESAEMAGNLSVTESNDGVRKKKRKRKMSDKGQEQDFEEPNETRQSDLPETTDAGEKRKKKRKREESEPVTPTESAADVVDSQTDEAVVLIKKKKKKKKKKKENPPTDIEDAELEISTLTSQEEKQFSSPLDPKSKSHDDSRTSDQVAKETADIAAPELAGNQVVNDVRDKKKKIKKKLTDDVLPEEKSLAESVELEPHKHKKKKKKEKDNPAEVPGFISSSSILSDTDTTSHFEISSSDKISKNKHIKGKRRLHNPSMDFLMP